MNAAEAYVYLAIEAMKVARNYDDLVEWWKGEQIRRRKYELSPEAGPGLRLKRAFDDTRRKLKLQPR